MHQLDEMCTEQKCSLQTSKHRALPSENKNLHLAITYMPTEAIMCYEWNQAHQAGPLI